MQAVQTTVGRLGLVLFCIYLVAGGIFLMITIMQQLDLAGPLTIGALSILIAFLAKLVFKDDLQQAGGSIG
jgi:hypothetical protein